MERNRIYLGDAYELIRQLPDASVDLIVTDPPYKIDGLSIRAHGILRESSHEKELVEANLGEGIDLSILDEFMRVMRNPNVYIWCNKEQLYDYMTYFCRERGCNFEVIVWAKNNAAPFLNGHYLKDKEYCLYFWKGVTVNPTYGTGKTFYYSGINVQDKMRYGHPTIKPEYIIRNLIENSSSEGQLVLDPFVGSGTTCAAAKKIGRDYIGFEINEKYWAAATDRLSMVGRKSHGGKLMEGKLLDVEQ